MPNFNSPSQVTTETARDGTQRIFSVVGPDNTRVALSAAQSEALFDHVKRIAQSLPADTLTELRQTLSRFAPTFPRNSTQQDVNDQEVYDFTVGMLDGNTTVIDCAQRLGFMMPSRITDGPKSTRVSFIHTKEQADALESTQVFLRQSQPLRTAQGTEYVPDPFIKELLSRYLITIEGRVGESVDRSLRLLNDLKGQNSEWGMAISWAQDGEPDEKGVPVTLDSIYSDLRETVGQTVYVLMPEGDSEVASTTQG